MRAIKSGFLASACLVAAIGHAAENSSDLRPVFFVATNGNDTWNGRSPTPKSRGEGPFRTVGRALRQARETKPALPDAAGPAIVLRQGIYFLDEPLVLTPPDSGLEISAYRDEKPTLSAGRRVSSWKETTVSGKTLWTAELPSAQSGKWIFRELWVNGRRAVRARHPNQGYFSIAGLPDKAADWTKGQNRFTYRPGDIQPWPGLTNAEVIAMARWVESRLPIEAVDEGEHLARFGKRAVFELAAGDLYYVEGALELLDQPGEWFLDSTIGRLYYWPRAGESLKTVEAIAPVLPQLIRLEGDPEKQKFVERVRFQGLTLAHAEWYFPTGFHAAKNSPAVSPAPAPEVGGFAQAAIGVPGMVWGQGVVNCRFERCWFTCLGDYALELGRGCRSNLISKCEFSQLGAGGIKLGETRLRDRLEDQTSDNEVSDCLINDGGQLFHSAIGLWIGQSPGNRIVHNHIHDFYYTAISIGWTWGYGPSSASNNLVAFNHVHHIGVKSNGDGPILSDMGGIYTLGKEPGARILNNLWHDIAGLRYGGWGIYFDEGSSGLLAASNVVYRTTHGGFHQHYGETNTVVNNIFAFARDHQLQRTRVEPHRSFTFQTNVIYFDSGVLLGGDWSGDQYEMDYNVYFDRRQAEPTIAFGNANLQQWRDRGHDHHSKLENPQFRAPDRNDFTLQPTSPALGLGFQPVDLSRVGARP